ncbi:MAG: phosphate transport system permease protein [Candidatus Peregrinibacteria bacterium Greene0416_19]|nr:MAG: phosphate transport system permease protein [Candidatus Peregrinibacteria bacterium Greene0416_19]
MKRPPASVTERIAFSLFRLSAIAGTAILILVMVLLFLAGKDALSWQFLTAPWQHGDITKGGIFPAIVGSMYLGLGVIFISFPLGIGTAVFLTEYSGDTRWRRTIQLAIRNLAGVPSVVYGLFGLAIFVHLLTFGMSLAAAVLTLSVMTLPWIITASVEALLAVPRAFRESSQALGATRWQTVSRIIIPSALPGCITGGIIGLARALGETAPIILVGATFYLTRLPTSPFDKYMALPYHTFILATQHSSPSAPAYAAGSALVLITLTFVLSIGAILLRLQFRKKRVW